jgi:hypothetical protein
MTVESGPTWFPLAPEEISAEWLTEVLRDSDALPEGGRVESFSYEPVAGGYVGANGRLRLQYAGERGDAPATLFAKLTPTYEPMKEFAKGFRLYEREVLFYREYAARSPVRAPRSYFVACDPGAPSCALLLEDLAPARTRTNVEGCPPEHAAEILKQVARLHAAWWESPEVLETPILAERGGTPASWQADYVKYLPATLDVLGDGLSAEVVELAHRVSEHVPAIIRAMAGRPCTLVHSDIHVGNVLLPTAEGGEFAIVDWQLIRLGRGVEDVSRLLFWSLHPEDRRAHERRLLETYHRELVAAGVVDYDFQTCWDDYRVLCLGQWVFGTVTAPNLDLSTETGRADAQAWAERVNGALTDVLREGVLERLG